MRGYTYALLTCRLLTLALGLAAVCASGMAQEAGITARLHPWGRFDPGAWKLVRVVTETLDEHGQVVSTNSADTKTTLVDIDNDGVTLEIQTCMEVAGKRFQAEPQTVKQGFHGELAGPSLKLQKPLDGEVVIEDRRRACKVQPLEIVGPTEKTNVRLYYSPTLWPYVLKRESRHQRPGGQDRPQPNRRRGDRLGHARSASGGNPERRVRQDGSPQRQGDSDDAGRGPAGRAGRRGQPQPEGSRRARAASSAAARSSCSTTASIPRTTARDSSTASIPAAAAK